MHCIKPSCILASMVVFFLIQLGQPVLTFAQEDLCDPNLKSSTTDPLGYQHHDDRCEGRYIQEVANTILLVASFTESFEQYDLESGEKLLIEWTAPEEQSVRLRSQGLRPRLYYRMDTVLLPDSTSYQWPTNILAALNVSSQDIGVVGWITGQNEQDIYVPLRISQKTPPKPSLSYQVILMPGRELTELYISLAPVQDDGEFGAFIQDGEALGYGFYPAEQGIVFETPLLGEPGVYYLEIGATLRRGGSATIELLFYHAG